MYSPFSPRSTPGHMQQAPSAPQMGKPMEAPNMPHGNKGGNMGGPGMSFGDRFQSGQFPNFMQQFQNSPMQQFMGPGSKYAQMMGGNPYTAQLQNIPFLGSLFGAPMQSIPGMNQPQQPQIGGPLPPTSI